MQRWPVFATQVGPEPLHQWLQFGSGALGLLALAIAARRWYRENPPLRPRAEQPRAAGWWRALVLAALVLLPLAAGIRAGAAAAGGGIRDLLLAASSRSGLETVAFAAVTTALGAAFATALLAAVGWRLRPARMPQDRAPEEVSLR